MNKQFRITCSYNESLKLDDLQDFQGHLKIRNDDDYKKIIKSIEKHGFSFPFFVWKHDDKNLVLDGHGRLRALQIMRDNGISIDEVPVVYVDVKNEKEAKDLLLRLNSQYGKMTKQSVMEFVGKDFDLNLNDFQLPAFNLDFSNPFEPVDDYYNKQIQQRDYVSPTTTAGNPVREMPLEGGIEMPPEEYLKKEYTVIEDDKYEEPVKNTAEIIKEKYTQKISTPIYEIQGSCPDISELYDTQKADELIKQIQDANLDSSVKDFLVMAAYRHVRFNYAKIAEYYAHADKNVQDLFEQSALVIIDFEKAIENGYVRMTERLKAMVEK